MASYQLSESDYVSASLFAARRRLVVVASLLAASFLLIALWAVLDARPLFSLTYLALLPFTLLLIWALRRWRAKRHYRQSALAHEPVTITPDADGFRISSSRGSTSMRWTDFHKCKRNERWILLFPNDSLFYMIPARALDAEERRLFEEGLRRIRRV